MLCKLILGQSAKYMRGNTPPERRTTNMETETERSRKEKPAARLAAKIGRQAILLNQNMEDLCD